MWVKVFCYVIWCWCVVKCWYDWSGNRCFVFNHHVPAIRSVAITEVYDCLPCWTWVDKAQQLAAVTLVTAAEAAAAAQPHLARPKPCIQLIVSSHSCHLVNLYYLSLGGGFRNISINIDIYITAKVLISLTGTPPLPWKCNPPPSPTHVGKPLW